MPNPSSHSAQPRRYSVARWLLAAALSAAPAAVPSRLAAQTPATVTGGDFDICDACANVTGNVLHLRGRTGFGTSLGTFTLVNAANDAQDVDHDGYTPGVDFTNLYLQQVTDFVNVADPSRVIQARNLIFGDFLNPLRNGGQNNVGVVVNVPAGTPAGTYRGFFVIADSVRLAGVNSNGESLRSDLLNVEIEVLGSNGFGLVQSDTAAELDSLALRGRPGQTVSGVVRVANLGNVNLANARLDATDLIATSGTGLRIRADRISFSPAAIPSVGVGDTARVTVSVRVPIGVLAGPYRGDLIVQADGSTPYRVPLIVNVTTPGDLVFENNPVVGRRGDNAVIIFNADPGTQWQMAVFDMRGIIAYKSANTVFAGMPAAGSSPAFPGDQAVRTVWNLVNGTGEPVAGGMYYVIVNAIQDGKRRQLRGKLMVIR